MAATTDRTLPEDVTVEDAPRRGSMLKLMQMLRRRPELSPAQFQEHWLERHARLVADVPAVRRYVQYHALAEDPVRASLQQAADAPELPTYDGVGITWWESPAALVRAMAGERYAAVRADEAFFIDTEHSVTVLADEQVQIEPQTGSPIVLVECLRRQERLSRAQFHEHWIEHAYLGREAHRRGLLSGYIQNHTLPEDDPRREGLGSLRTGDEPWDGVTTAYFQTAAIAMELFRSPLASEEAYEDERKFIDHSKALFVMTRRHVIKEPVR